MISAAEVTPRGLKSIFAHLLARGNRRAVAALQRQVESMDKDSSFVASLMLGGAKVQFRFATAFLERGFRSISIDGKVSDELLDLEGAVQDVQLAPNPKWDVVWKQRRREDKLVVRALAKVGVKARSVYDLVNERVPFGPEVAEPLLKVLPRVREKHLRDGVFRALRSPGWPQPVRERVIGVLKPLAAREKDKEVVWLLRDVLRALALRG